MKIHYLQHAEFEGLGTIDDWVKVRGHEVTKTEFYRGDPAPSLDPGAFLIVLGGSMNVDDTHRYPFLIDEKRLIEKAIGAGHGVLGICLGAQLVASVLGARVYPNRWKEIGWFPVQKTEHAAQSRIADNF